jgi:hypothetical protein
MTNDGSEILTNDTICILRATIKIYTIAAGEAAGSVYI